MSILQSSRWLFIALSTTMKVEIMPIATNRFWKSKMWSIYTLEYLCSHKGTENDYLLQMGDKVRYKQSHSRYIYIYEKLGGGQFLQAESRLVTMGNGVGMRRECVGSGRVFFRLHKGIPCFVVHSSIELQILHFSQTITCDNPLLAISSIFQTTQSYLYF